MPSNREPAFPRRAGEDKPDGPSSGLRLFGLPLIDIAIGPESNRGRMHGHARGIIAIGHIATGWIAIGFIARGGLAIGSVAIGVVAIGGAACGVFEQTDIF